MKTGILNSVPAGRTYRLKPIVKRPTRANASLKLRQRGKSVVVGYVFHRASSAGQPPAILSGRLINSIRARKVAEFRYRVGTDVIYARRLDLPQGLNRPFFLSVAERYRPRFLENVRVAYFGE